MTARARFAAVALAAALAWTGVGAGCDRIVAVGDVHGGFDAFRRILREAGLIDDRDRWTGGGACLVQLGDDVDRGERSRDVLDLLMRLESEAPGRVHVLIGNHEVLNVVGDLRYVTDGEYAAFAPDETPAERQAGLKAFRATTEGRELGRRQARETFDARYPPGWFAHRRAFAPDGLYGSWILSHAVLLRLDDTLFVHGGIEPADAATGVEALNREIPAEVREFVRLRDELVAAGWIPPLAEFGEDFRAVAARLGALAEAGAEGSDDSRPTAVRFLELRRARFVDPEGPLWTRRLALEDEAAYAPTVDGLLEVLGVRRIVVGHTVQQDHRIHARFGGRVFPIDTGAGPYYGSHPSALEIVGDRVRALYPGQSEILVEAEPAAAAAAPGR